jgi:hypothetical protein
MTLPPIKNVALPIDATCAGNKVPGVEKGEKGVRGGERRKVSGEKGERCQERVKKCVLRIAGR